jgi:hypothetical protein
MIAGHFGDATRVGEGFELRIHAGPGCRAYYGRDGDAPARDERADEIVHAAGDGGRGTKDFAAYGREADTYPPSSLARARPQRIGTSVANAASAAAVADGSGSEILIWSSPPLPPLRSTWTRYEVFAWTGTLAPFEPHATSVDSAPQPWATGHTETIVE